MSATSCSERAPLDEDLELLTASGDEVTVARRSPAKIAISIVGAAFFAAIATAYVVSSSNWESDWSEDKCQVPGCARELLESPELANTIKNNYLSVRPELKAKEEHLLKKVQRSMAKITTHIKETEPKVFQQLNLLPLTNDQKNDVLKVVGNMADPRVQAVGKEVAKMSKDSKVNGNKFSLDAMKRKLADTLQKNKTKLAQLREEIFPAPLRKMLDNNLELTVDSDKMRLIRNSHDSWEFELSLDKPTSRRLLDDEWTNSAGSSAGDVSETNPGSTITGDDLDGMSTKLEEGLGILCGMLEQARVALDQIDFVGESFDVDMKIPYWAKSLVGGLDFVSELTDCVMRGESNEVKLMMCPMKYASAATDFLESFDNIMGLSNGHFFSDETTPPPRVGYVQPQYQQLPTAGSAQPQYQPQGSQALYR